MKVRLTLSKEEIQGYNNIKPDQLRALVDNECKEIFCDNILKFISFDMIEVFFKDLLSKLRYQGELVISDIDTEILIRLFLEREIEEKDFNKEITPCYGFYNCKFIKDQLYNLGLKIEEAKIVGKSFYIKAVRSVN